MPKYATSNLKYFKEVKSTKTENFEIISNENSHLGDFLAFGLVSNQRVGTRDLPLILHTDTKLNSKDIHDMVQRARSDGRAHYLSLQENDNKALSYFRDAGAEIILDLLHLVSFQVDDLLGVKSKLRKSYKSLVNKNDNIEIVNSRYEYAIEQCRLLHLKIAGRATRSNFSWELLAKSLIANKAILVTQVVNGTLVGYNYFMRDRNKALYASAVVEQDYNGHALMWESIKFLHKTGANNIYLDTNLQDYKKTNKESNISKYKIGFCNEVEPHYIIRL